MMLPFLKARIGGANIDMLPNPFSFATVGGQNPNVDVASAVTRITGISVPVPVSCDAGSFRILAADAATPLTGWVTFGTIRNNQCVQLLRRSSNAYSGQVGMTVYVGKGSAPWYVNTVGVSGYSGGWGTPGQYAVAVGHHNSISIDVYGAGGGGGGHGGWSANYAPFSFGGGDGGGGGYTQVYDEETGGGRINIIGWAGGGGQGMYPTGGDGFYNGGGGGHGSGQGGNVVYAGGAGGGGGGQYGPRWDGATYYSGAGGTGGRSYYTWGRGLITPGTRLIINVGQGGSPGGNNPYNDYGAPQYGGGWGGNGAAYISWG